MVSALDIATLLAGHFRLQGEDASLVAAFLDDLEKVRGITPRTRNLRLTAIHSFFRYVAFEDPPARRRSNVLAIPPKRFARTLVPFLSRPEVAALLAAPDRRTWSGRRDHALILLAVQTGLRLSELTGLRQQDVHLGTGAHVSVIGKGRKQRCTPLSKNTRSVLAAWLKEPLKHPEQPLFPNASGSRLSAHGVHYLLAKHVAIATRACPSLKHKRVSPHVLRHTTAMDLLQQGVEQSVLALWLGLVGKSLPSGQVSALLTLASAVGAVGLRHARGDAMVAFARSSPRRPVVWRRGGAAHSERWTPRARVRRAAPPPWGIRTLRDAPYRVLRALSAPTKGS